MKDEINTILNYLECEGEMFRLRNQLLPLSAFQPDELQRIIVQLVDVINQTNIQNHKYAGYYYLFLGCAYFEQDEYPKAVTSLQSAINELWGAQVNKALAHWMLGLCYSNMQEFPKARNELQEALQMLATQRGTNSLRAEREYHSRQTIRQNIKNAYERLFNEPLFRTVRPESTQSADRFRAQDPPEAQDDAAPISITNENYPFIHAPVTVTNENHPVNKLSFTPPPPDVKAKTVTKKQEDETTENTTYETRTDDGGYLVIHSVPVYENFVYAGKSGKSEPVLSSDRFAEFYQVNLDGVSHVFHSLKSKRVNVIREGDWGWIKVKGKSMNGVEKVPINNGDYVLFHKNSNAGDNDIVIAVNKDTHSTHIKRLRKYENILYSETNETGPEYDPIDMKAKNMEIMGIVYAVAKPITL